MDLFYFLHPIAPWIWGLITQTQIAFITTNYFITWATYADKLRKDLILKRATPFDSLINFNELPHL